MRYLLISFLASIAAGCCSLVSKSEYTIYRGKLNISNADSTIEIYADNIRLGAGLFRNGSSVPTGTAKHPDSSGYFLISGTTQSHNECEHPNHWEGGALEIYVTGTNILPYHDTLFVDEMKLFPKLNPDSLGYKLGSSEIGIWQLPDIVLQPK